MISSLIYRRVRPLIEENEAEGGRPGKCGSHNSYDVGLNRISLTSMSSGWLMAKSTQRAKLSAGIAYFFRSFRFSVPRWGSPACTRGDYRWREDRIIGGFDIRRFSRKTPPVSGPCSPARFSI